jgi:DNA polymerase-3 subunit delta'
MNAFAPLVGQRQAVELLTQAVDQNRIAPAYLFAGVPGVGKSLAARCFVEYLFSAGRSSGENKRHLDNHPDLLWVEPTYLHNGVLLSATEAASAGVKRKAPPQIRLEQIRRIAQFLSCLPLESSRSVVVISAAETMAEAAANGLLKTLEEPGQATLILIAPSPESLLPTLVSRCQRVPFHTLDQVCMGQVLTLTGYEEILTNSAVLNLAQGSPGKAIASWQQLQTIPQDLLKAVTELPKSLRDALELARKIDKILDTEAQLWLVDYLQHCYWQQFWAGSIHHSPLQQLEKARASLLCYAQPRLVWEVTLMKISQTDVF